MLSHVWQDEFFSLLNLAHPEKFNCEEAFLANYENMEVRGTVPRHVPHEYIVCVQPIA